MRVTNKFRNGDPGISVSVGKVSGVPDVNVNSNVNVCGKVLGDSEVRRIPIVDTTAAAASSSSLSSTTTSLFGPSNSGGVVVGVGVGIGTNNGTVKTTTTTSTSSISHSPFVIEGTGDVTINNTNSKYNNSGGSCSCSAVVAVTPSTKTEFGLVSYPENGNDIGRVGVYNGIFLVDGLGHGVRIERQTQMMAAAEGGHYEYGLPEQNSATGFTSRERERQFYTGTPQLYNEQNPVCIRIDAGTCTSPMIHNNPNTSRFCVGVTCPSQNYFSGQNPDATSTAAAVIPVLPSCSSSSSVVVPKPTNRNSVTLPVPSPPPHTHTHTQGNFGVSPLPGLNVTGIALGIASERETPTPNNIASSSATAIPKTHNSGNLMERTLISTEAQTEDLPALTTLPPPPPPSRNREQRKRERRERRRADRSQSQIFHSHHSLVGHRNSAPGPSRMMPGYRSATEANHENNNIIYANTTTLNPEQQQQRSDHSHTPGGGRNSQVFCESSTANNNCQGQLGLPDLLNSHLPPPYSTLPQTCERRVVLGNVPLHAPVMVQGHLHPPLQIQGMPLQGFPAPPMIQTAPQPIIGPGGPPPPAVCLASPSQPVRYHFAPTARASRRSLRTPRGVPYASEEEPKSCCGMSTSQAVSIRWFIIVIAVIGICCTVAGTALGAARSAGSQHLTLSLLMIGVGVVLLTVSAVAWRLTANESGTSCRVMLGFARNGSSRGDGGAEPNRRFVPRLAPSYGRPHHPYAAMMYPDFQYRPPPPSYQASMQEYRLRLLLLERSNPTIAAAAGLANQISSNMVPPPPAYRPYNGLRPGGMRHEIDFTRPPSYRSRSSGGYGYQENSPGSRPSFVPGMEHPQHTHMMDSPIHSRDPSILSYLSQQSMGDNVSVVSGGPGTNGQANPTSAVVTVMQAVSVGMDLGMMSPMTYDPTSGVRCDGPEDGENKEMPESNEDEGLVVVAGKKSGLHCEKSGLSKDGNLVRIVQTTDSSQVIGRNSVIVTVSGSNHSLWDQSLQNAVNNNTNSNVNSHSVGNPTISENNEVQILAHL